MSSTSRLRLDTTAVPMIVVINAMSPLVTWKPSVAPTTRTDTSGTYALGSHRLRCVGADPAGVDPEPDRHRDRDHCQQLVVERFYIEDERRSFNNVMGSSCTSFCASIWSKRMDRSRFAEERVWAEHFST